MAVLKSGAKGEQVEALQRQLLGQGFNPGKIDGVFGPKTETAVKSFQKRAGLSADGIAGAKTMASLAEVAAKVGSKTKRGFRDLIGRSSATKKSGGTKEVG